jgi:hypothetical protein
MRLAYDATPYFRQDLQWRLIYALFLPLFVISEGGARLYARYVADDGEPAPARGSWTVEARSQASIATSCALMAKSMLQSSERRNRAERLSRL